MNSQKLSSLTSHVLRAAQMLLTSNPSLASRQLREALTQLRGAALGSLESWRELFRWQVDVRMTLVNCRMSQPRLR